MADALGLEHLVGDPLMGSNNDTAIEGILEEQTEERTHDATVQGKGMTNVQLLAVSIVISAGGSTERHDISGLYKDNLLLGMGINPQSLYSDASDLFPFATTKDKEREAVVRRTMSEILQRISDRERTFKQTVRLKNLFLVSHCHQSTPTS